MSGVARDPMWQELERFHFRVIPRYDAATYGRCCYCLNGPTGIFQISTETWAGCHPCENGWHAGTRLLEPIHDEDFLELQMAQLSTFTISERFDGSPITKGDTMTADRPAAVAYDPALHDFNPWPGAKLAERGERRTVHDAPPWWVRLAVPSQARLAGVAIWANAQPPGKRTVLEQARAELDRQHEAGDPIVRRLFMNDLRDTHGPGFTGIETIVRQVQLAGGALAFLQNQRTQLDTLIERLRTIVPQAG